MQRKTVSRTSSPERSVGLELDKIKTPQKGVDVSVVVPVFNEEESFLLFSERLLKTMDSTRKIYEVIFIDDGSRDGTPKMLRKLFKDRSDVIRVITFNGNYGQYVAILAGFEHVRGDIAVTLDADLQNPPEEIPKLLRKMEEGYDLVGGYRAKRQDNWFRTNASKMANFIRSKVTGIETRDHGCMLRAYRKFIIDEVVKTRETSTFITALAQKFAGNPIDIPVAHEERVAGKSKYNIYKLIRITFDLLTGFSLAPLQAFTILGMIISSISGLYFFIELFKKVIGGHHGYGLHFAFVFLLLSVIILGVGLLGEYLGRAYFAVCEHPRFVIREILEMRTTRENNLCRNSIRSVSPKKKTLKNV
ncbi:MAG: glycosyltransferase [Holosporaceae bacterium]|jgi:undecaprenyl-phosphate 4-deoxy-4-formamido-L-arabinose transferase|nr:glycosyltransferase [Holosporaceae bacterium]